ncbi:glycosyltransferase family 2 protein [Paenibacillus sp. J22TS3]|uniref:glycosyltransferase family 2 protein n=1 Tax=Paenibacillus sp. J22TS3 TaxID=2807192 RepID=UPI001B036B24|nr:glycosyltransferase family 2 protein [Paenibacillus sp. J22TS3]GIP24107.1 hypothetical protein J22TS3_43820 [Paenibacillus sp. J22TS3]
MPVVRKKARFKTGRRRRTDTRLPGPASGRHGRERYSRGYKAGYTQGVKAGIEDFGKAFEGTSIIIPTYNGRELLMKCIDSIEAHTTHPFEIIVVDNGSTDGTVKALRSRAGSIRIGLHESNLGFARAVNTGLMMSKGRTIVLLNNDTLVTERWLSNLLLCLESSPEIGAVGPVTNYIGGEQQIEVPYREVSEMWPFAAAYNQSNPSRWQTTDRLAGFCLLMKREVWERSGYFDEGYRIGNFEDDDLMVRLRYLGRSLLIAGDTFIHHTGSMTMRTLGAEGYREVNEGNRQFFAEKWGNSFERLQVLKAEGRLNSTLKTADYFPAHIRVRDSGGRCWWLEQGRKHLILDDDAQLELLPLPEPVLLSMVDLRLLGTAEPLAGAEVRRRMEEISTRSSSGEEAVEGAVYRLADGRWMQVQQGSRREFITAYAAQSWGVEARTPHLVPEHVLALPEGLPILPRVSLIAGHL